MEATKPSEAVHEGLRRELVAGGVAVRVAGQEMKRPPRLIFYEALDDATEQQAAGIGQLLHPPLQSEPIVTSGRNAEPPLAGADVGIPHLGEVGMKVEDELRPVAVRKVPHLPAESGQQRPVIPLQSLGTVVDLRRGSQKVPPLPAAEPRPQRDDDLQAGHPVHSEELDPFPGPAAEGGDACAGKPWRDLAQAPAREAEMRLGDAVGALHGIAAEIIGAKTVEDNIRMVEGKQLPHTDQRLIRGVPLHSGIDHLRRYSSRPQKALEMGVQRLALRHRAAHDGRVADDQNAKSPGRPLPARLGRSQPVSIGREANPLAFLIPSRDVEPGLRDPAQLGIEAPIHAGIAEPPIRLRREEAYSHFRKQQGREQTGESQQKAQGDGPRDRQGWRRGYPVRRFSSSGLALDKPL